MDNIFSQPTDPQALALTHAIALQESGQGGKPDYTAVGDAGTSKGAYQWQPGNFEAAAKSAGLDPNDFSPQNQDKVAYSEVKGYKDKGYDPGQIASLWNSGSPNNWQNHSGTTTINGKTISYDTPAYVKGVQGHYQQLTNSSGSGLPSLPSAVQPGQPQGQTPGLPNLPGAVMPQSQSTDTTQQPQQAKEGLLQKASDILTTLFPGSKTLGEYLGTKLAESQATPGGKQFIQQNEAGPTGGQALAATGELGLEGASAAIPGGGGLLSRLGTSAALGAGIGGLGAAATGKNVVQGAALGGVAGGALQGAGEGLSALTQYIPKSIISAKFPKLSEDAADYLVNNKPIGTAKQMYNATQTDMGRVGQEIGDTLEQPQYADRLINSQEVMGRAVAGDPNIPKSGLTNSGATPLTLRKTLNSLVGKTSGGLINKLFPAEGGIGSLTLSETHDLSSDLGNAIRKSFADQPNATQNKKVGQQLYFALTSSLKDNAPELSPLFEEYSKNAQIATALEKAVNKTGALGLTDYLTLLAGAGGGLPFGGSIPGAIGALAAKRAIQSPTADIAAAKGVAALGRGLKNPVVRGLGSMGKMLGSAYAQSAYNGATH